MGPALLFGSLCLGVRTAGAKSVVSGIREMSALRQIIFRPAPRPLPELPPPPKDPVVPPKRIFRTADPVVVEREVAVVQKRRPSTSGGGDRYAPYRLLWVKVIIRAAYDYALWKDSKDLRHRKFAEDARKWLFEPSDLENSLEHLCELWGLPLGKIRHFASNLTKEDVKKLEFKERQGRDLTQGALAEKVAGPGERPDG